MQKPTEKNRNLIEKTISKLKHVHFLALFLTMIMTITFVSRAIATTKGLNQIVTPDVQPEGILSVSFQQTDPNITDRYQAQLEYGFSKRFEAALFQGFSPDDEVLNVEYGIVQAKSFLLSTGFSDWSTEGVAPQPYLESGYLSGRSYAMLGITNEVISSLAVPPQPIRNVHQLQAIVGYAYHVTPILLMQVDYQGSGSNFSTLGFNYSLTPTLQFNPALYLSNNSPVKGYGYVVLTYNITIHQ